jgi:NADH dehydrogenase (ubiquinone) 1 beta subcomplex subunit 9
VISRLTALTELKVLLRETEKLLESWKHPDPYRAPTAPGGMGISMSLHARKAANIITGSKYERNLPVRDIPCT